MPVSRPSDIQPTGQDLSHLRPYTHHGLHLDAHGLQATGDCPFCGKDGKFSVAIDTGQWKCWVCGSGNERGGGNALTFIRLLHDRSASSTPRPFLTAVATDRKLDPDTPSRWGLCRSIIDGKWLLPGFGIDGKMTQLYRRVQMDGVWRLLPTSGDSSVWPEGKVHALHAPVIDLTLDTMDFFEGPWDAMAAAEVMEPGTNIIGVPGCNVWRDEWTLICQGKRVRLWYDSDHPRTHGTKTFKAGYDAMQRIAKRLSGVAKSVQYLYWGKEGYDPNKPSGWDVRDELSSSDNRRVALAGLLGRMEPVPAEWFTPHHLNGIAHSGNPEVEPEYCNNWLMCEGAWRNALEWRGELSDVMACMLAVAASTNQSGDNQLFLQVIGDPGCLHGDTPIYDPTDGTTKTVRDRWANGADFHVWSKLNNGEIGVCPASAPYQLSPEPMYRVTFKSGRQITTTAAHQFWNGYTYLTLRQVRDALHEFGAFHLPSISERTLLTRALGDRRCMKKVQDSQSSCSFDFCLCGEPPLGAASIDLYAFPSQDGVLEHTRRCLHMGGLEPTDTRIHPTQFCLRSTLDFLTQHDPLVPVHSLGYILQLFLAYNSYGWHTPLQSDHSYTDQLPVVACPYSMHADADQSNHLRVDTGRQPMATHQQSALPSSLSVHPHIGRESLPLSLLSAQSAYVGLRIGDNGYPYSIYDWDTVVEVEPAGVSPYYDFHVPGTENYWACGVINHNSAKTRMCKGLLVSSRCKLLLHLKSFHSGMKGEDGKDLSLVSRINGLCLVTPEADALLLGANYDVLNSQMRQIFDGETGHTYGNSDVDQQYKGLRSPWIQAGTPALMDKDQSRLGDRFLRIRIEQPTERTKQAILLRALRNERQAVVERSNGTESSIIPPKLRKAYALTGGYVDWLRTHVEDEIPTIEMPESIEMMCVDLAILTADMRARPNSDPRKHETHHSKELPSRLVSQFGRLAMCLAVVFNKRAIDKDVMRVVRKVALDTAHGHTLNITRWLCSSNPKAQGRTYQECGGLSVETLEIWSGMTKERLNTYLLFLRTIGVLEWKQANNTHGLWVLTQRSYELYVRAINADI